LNLRVAYFGQYPILKAFLAQDISSSSEEAQPSLVLLSQQEAKTASVCVEDFAKAASHPAWASPPHVIFRWSLLCTWRNPVGWKRPFDEPIALPRGRQLISLEDAGDYITKIPKAEHEAPEWHAAMEAFPGGREDRPNNDGSHRRHAGADPPSPAGRYRPEVSERGN
jgi:hypothetical protein